MVGLSNGTFTPERGSSDYYEGLFGKLKDKAEKNKQRMLGREV